MKNSLLPVITLSTLQLGTLVGGTVVTETVFFLPGIGKFIVDAVIAKDFLVVQMGLMILDAGGPGSQPHRGYFIRVPGPTHSV